MKWIEAIDWTTDNLLKVNSEGLQKVSIDEPLKLRKKIEPWLSALFQSEHLSLLAGAGLTSAVAYMADVTPQGMGRLDLTHSYGANVKAKAQESAGQMGRGEANLEDDLRIAFELLRGLEIIGSSDSSTLKTELDKKLLTFIKAVLQTESDFMGKLLLDDVNACTALLYLKTFLLSFSSRTASRERLNLFTTNYDRFIEYGCDEAGILAIDRFRGKIQPIFRTSKLELDYHYNPPGVRGEPRYVEGVIKFSKIHGSIDWRLGREKIIRELLPFGASDSHPGIPSSASDHIAIFPNSSKDIETAFFPYAELFREFSTSICRPNSVIVTYGYGFGDSHINRIIADMLTIPSTHLVIISFEDKSKKIQKFCTDKNASQVSLLLGNHLGNLEALVDYYLPKSSIDRITIAMQGLKARRGEAEAMGYATETETSKENNNQEVTA